MLIPISDTYAIAADDISELRIDAAHNCVFIVKRGSAHGLTVDRHHGESVFACYDRILAAVNAARQPPKVGIPDAMQWPRPAGVPPHE